MEMFQLDCSIQNYQWGKVGDQSLVARFKKNASKDFTIDQNKTYAELWMGCHPNGPSLVRAQDAASDGLALSDLLIQCPELLGSKVREKFGDQLPFLLKVLSVAKALSIQAHPSKSHAEILHREHPNLYPDPNHKPEMAIALTPFEALCGFRPLKELKSYVQIVPELTEVLGTENVDDIMSAEEESSSAKEALRNAFTTLMNAKPSQFEPLLESLVQRLRKEVASNQELVLDEALQLLLRLNEQFPADIGCFGVFFFNYLKLEPQQAIFLAANEPHAYLFGDCVECMACSDNTVRAGLTPKHLDVPTLCSMLTYQMRPKEENIFPGQREDDLTTLYKVPVPDFAMACIKVPPVTESYELIPRDSASILILVTGHGTVKGKTNLGAVKIEMIPGVVVFLASGINASFHSSGKDSLLFQAFNM